MATLPTRKVITLRHILFGYHRVCRVGFRQQNTAARRMDDLLETAKQCIPPLDGTSHKGQAGRIGVVGGSVEYTGAPYFAGISALKVGADLVHIFCTQSAAPVIKSYSPELIVHPLLDADNGLAQVIPWLERLHAVVIGPGLGRDPGILQTATGIIYACNLRKIPLIVDADGLFLLNENPSLLKRYPSPGVVLTPNKIEFQRLFPKYDYLIENHVPVEGTIRDIGGNVSVLRKGSTDDFLSSFELLKWSSDIGGSGRRCGGQGDLLSGSVAVFLHWALSCKDTVLSTIPEERKSATAARVATYAAARLVRLCNEKAYREKGRSMLAGDMIDHIHDAFEELFES